MSTTENNKVSPWSVIINSVKTPLGFFTLVLLVLDGILVGTASLTDRVSVLIPLLLIAVTLIIVATIAVIKPQALYHPDDWRTLTVNLQFPIAPIDVDLDIDNCKLEIRNPRASSKQVRSPNLTFGQGGWSFQLDDMIDPKASIRIDLVEHSGRMWRVKPFAPYSSTQAALKVDEG